MKFTEFDDKNSSGLDVDVSNEVIKKPALGDLVVFNSDSLQIPDLTSNENDEDVCKTSKISKSRRVIYDLSDEEGSLNSANVYTKESHTDLSEDSHENDDSSDHSYDGQQLLPRQKPPKKKRVKALVSDSDEESTDSPASETIGRNVPPISPPKKENTPSYMSMFQNSDLYDAEGSSDEETYPNTSQVEKNNHEKKEEIQMKPIKKKAPPKKSKLTALEEIHSETQRMVRHSRVTLPYHQPKQRSLSEFLSRKKVPCIPLKTTSEVLNKVWMCIEEREKTAESFYKSESDNSEDENINSKIKINSDNKLKNYSFSTKDISENSITTPIEIISSSKNNTVDVIEHNSLNDTNKDLFDGPVSKSSSNNGISISGDMLETLGDKSSVINAIENDCLEFSESDSLKLQLTENTLIEISTLDKSTSLSEVDNSIQIDSNNSEKITVGSEEQDFNKNKTSSIGQKETGNSDTVLLNDSNSHQDIELLTNSERLDTKKKIHSLLHHSLLDIKLDRSPQISGSPDSFIDLDEGSEKPAAFQLVSRFMKHAKLKPRAKKLEQKISVSIAETNAKGEVISLNEEIINIKVGENSKPGETRVQLKAKLQEKIAERREKEFVKRIEEYKLSEEFFEDETKDEVSDVEEIDEDFNILDSSCTESEPEENDVDISDKAKKCDNPFLEDEAEESDDEDNEENDAKCDKDSSEDEEVEEESNDSTSLSPNIAALLDDKVDMSNGSSQNTQVFGGVSEFSGLCSGRFPTQGLNLKDLEKNDTCERPDKMFNGLGKNTPISGGESGFSGLCSGSFPTQNFNLEDLEKDNSEGSEGQNKGLTSGLLEEKYEEDPVNKKNTTIDMDNDSSDEEIVTKKPKKKMKLEYSDDEEDDINDIQNSADSQESKTVDEEVNEDDNDDFIDDNDEEDDDKNLEVAEKNDEYDEDEDEEAFLKKPKVAAKQFFEDEAELSGSEYGSADEDEVDLDKYEEEEGDNDVLNGRKVQRDLEKYYRRALLKEDDQELLVLKELLLKDGDLHSDGPKRQRQFKWYNQDENDVLQDSPLDDEGRIDRPDEEEDESWRKTRLEREKFLSGFQDADDIHPNELDLHGVAALKNRIIKAKVPTPKADTSTFKSPNPRKQFTLITKRGSFLNRGEKILSKIVELTNGSSDNPLGNTRGQRNMVFAVVSPPKEKELTEQTTKRKNSDHAPTAAKRLKFTPINLNNKKRTSVFEKLRMNETL